MLTPVCSPAASLGLPRSDDPQCHPYAMAMPLHDDADRFRQRRFFRSCLGTSAGHFLEVLRFQSAILDHSLGYRFTRIRPIGSSDGAGDCLRDASPFARAARPMPASASFLLDGVCGRRPRHLSGNIKAPPDRLVRFSVSAISFHSRRYNCWSDTVRHCRRFGSP
jgi:hypothetical protein